MAAALPAFCAEAIFYIAVGFPEARGWFARMPSRRTQAAGLWASALAPYLLFSLGSGTFERHAFTLLIGLTGVLSFWYAILPRRWAYDVGFLVIAGAPVLLRVFQRIYLTPDGHLGIEILGHLMWIRVALSALLILRQWDPGPFGFWPQVREWKAGLLYYGLIVIPVVALGLALHVVRWEPLHGEWWQVLGIAVGTFWGMLWVVAFSEELFFRGLVERAILNRRRSPGLAIGASAVLYGSVHLWYRTFPNWRYAVVVTLLGIALGTAYWRSGSVRGPMVTHALMVTTWRVLFRNV